MRYVRLVFPAAVLMLVALAATGLQWGPALGQTKEKDRIAAVNKLEYKVVVYNNSVETDEVENSLNKLGKEGWECILGIGGAGVSTGGGVTPGTFKVILKRPKL